MTSEPIVKVTPEKLRANGQAIFAAAQSVDEVAQGLFLRAAADQWEVDIAAAEGRVISAVKVLIETARPRYIHEELAWEAFQRSLLARIEKEIT